MKNVICVFVFLIFAMIPGSSEGIPVKRQTFQLPSISDIQTELLQVASLKFSSVSSDSGVSSLKTYPMMAMSESSDYANSRMYLIRKSHIPLDDYSSPNDNKKMTLEKLKNETLELNLQGIIKYSQLLPVVANFIDDSTLYEIHDDEKLKTILQQCRDLGKIISTDNNYLVCLTNILKDIASLAATEQQLLKNIRRQIDDIKTEARNSILTKERELEDAKENKEVNRIKKQQYNINDINRSIDNLSNEINGLDKKIRDLEISLATLWWFPGVSQGLMITLTVLKEKRLQRLSDRNYYYSQKDSHDYYERSEKNWSDKVDRIKKDLSEVEKNFKMTDAFSTSLIEQSAFWRKIEESFKEIQQQAEEALSHLSQGEDNLILVPGTLCAVSNEAKCPEIFLPEIQCISSGQQNCKTLKDRAIEAIGNDDEMLLSQFLGCDAKLGSAQELLTIAQERRKHNVARFLQQYIDGTARLPDACNLD